MKALCIHHSAINDELPQFDRIKKYHDAGAGGKWPKGHGIQYHIFGERSGERIMAHDVNNVTWHSGSPEWNIKSFAYCLAGDLRFQEPTEAQLQGLFATWKELCFPPVVYHKEIRPEPTKCPGTFPFREELEKMRMADLETQLRLAEKSLPRFEGTPRGNLLRRLIKRLKSLLNRV